MIDKFLNDEEKEEIERFKTRLQAKKLAPSSVNIYLFYVKKFLIFKRKFTPLQYAIDKMFSEEVATGEVARASIRAYFEYAQITDKVVIPKITGRYSRQIIACPKSHVEKVLPLLSTIYDKIIVKLTWKGALRSKEVVSLKGENILFNRIPKAIRIIGKGNSERFVLISDEIAQMIRDYMDQRNIQPGDYLFPDVMKLKHPTRHFRWIMESAGNKIGVKYSPHKLRHGRASEMINKGLPLPSVQSILGHKNLSTTSVYIHLDENMVAKQLSRIDEDKFTSNRCTKKIHLDSQFNEEEDDDILDDVGEDDDDETIQSNGA